MRENDLLHDASPARSDLALRLAPGLKRRRVAASYRTVAAGIIFLDSVPSDARISAVLSEEPTEERVPPRHPSEINSLLL